MSTFVVKYQSFTKFSIRWPVYYLKVSSNVKIAVAISPVVLRWLCDSPRTGCAWRTTPYIYVARTSNNRVIPMEWSWWETSNNACEPGEQLILLANGDDESDLVGWSLLLLAATVRSFAHMPLGISDRNIAIQRFENFGGGKCPPGCAPGFSPTAL